MAGTGELNVLRRFRVMHGQVRKETDYGTHMAVHMALGLLFLGKGRFTLGTSKIATAALLCTFYPVFPRNPSCNRFHLQALRHMWVLAVEPRCLVARDVDSGMSVYLRLKFKLCERAEHQKDESMTAKYLTAPTLMPSLPSIVSIQTDSPRYWPITLDFRKVKEHYLFFVRNQTIFVKRKAGHLSYAQDPRGIQSLYTQPESEGAANVFDSGATERILVAKSAHIVNLVAAFQSSSPIAQAELKALCLTDQDDLDITRLRAGFMTNVTMECLMQDKPEAISVYRGLLQVFERNLAGAARDDQALAFVMAFHEDVLYGRLFGTRRHHFVSRDYIEEAYTHAEGRIDYLVQDQQFIKTLSYYLCDEAALHIGGFGEKSEHRSLALFLQYPARSILRSLARKVATLRQADKTSQPAIDTMLPTMLARMLDSLPIERVATKRSDAKLVRLLAAALSLEAGVRESGIA